MCGREGGQRAKGRAGTSEQAHGRAGTSEQANGRAGTSEQAHGPDRVSSLFLDLILNSFVVVGCCFLVYHGTSTVPWYSPLKGDDGDS